MVPTCEIGYHTTERPDAPASLGVNDLTEQVVHRIAQRVFELSAIAGNVACSSTPPDDSGLQIHRDPKVGSTILLDAYRIQHHGSSTDAKTRHVAQTLRMRVTHSPETNDVAEQWQYHQQPDVLSGARVEDLQQEFLTFVADKLTKLGDRSHTLD